LLLDDPILAVDHGLIAPLALVELVIGPLDLQDLFLLELLAVLGLIL
jgi:hypothetical protein